MVLSYVDDGLIGVAGDSVGIVKNRLEEVYGGCVETAVSRGMGFSGLKTRWIGFGRHDWDMLGLNGVEVADEDDLRILGMRFAKDGKMGKHVGYWLKRGLGVRARIGALARRFGGFGGLGAWEVMRLLQGAYIPTVEYGLEFVLDDAEAVKRIDIHVRDCLPSLFRMPLRLANNILHSECGIPLTHIRGTYIRSRCAQRFLNYRYCDHFLWHGSVRDAWCLPGMEAVRMTSLEVLSGTQMYTIAPNKEMAKVEGLRLIDTSTLGSEMVGFVDGSTKGTGCGCVWVAYVGLGRCGVGLVVCLPHGILILVKCSPYCHSFGTYWPCHLRVLLSVQIARRPLGLSVVRGARVLQVVYWRLSGRYFHGLTGSPFAGSPVMLVSSVMRLWIGWLRGHVT